MAIMNLLFCNFFFLARLSSPRRYSASLQFCHEAVLGFFLDRRRSRWLTSGFVNLFCSLLGVVSAEAEARRDFWFFASRSSLPPQVRSSASSFEDAARMMQSPFVGGS